MADQPGLTVTSQVTVTVNQTLTSIVVSPASATVNTSASQQFTATARDQFGTNLATQPTFTWTVSGGGTISSSGLFTAGTTAGGPYTVTATSGGTSGTASVTVSATPTTVYQINCGSSSAASPYTADQYGSGGTMHTVTNTITISGITNPAPQAVYQSRALRQQHLHPAQPDRRQPVHGAPALRRAVPDRHRQARVQRRHQRHHGAVELRHLRRHRRPLQGGGARVHRDRELVGPDRHQLQTRHRQRHHRGHRDHRPDPQQSAHHRDRRPPRRPTRCRAPPRRCPRSAPTTAARRT